VQDSAKPLVLTTQTALLASVSGGGSEVCWHL